MSTTGKVIATVAGREYSLVAGLAAIEEIEERLDMSFASVTYHMDAGLKTRDTKAIFSALSGVPLDEINPTLEHVGHVVEMQSGIVKAIAAASVPKKDGEGETGADAQDPPTESLTDPET